MFGRLRHPDLDTCLSLTRTHGRPSEVVSIVQVIAATAVTIADDLAMSLLEAGRSQDPDRLVYDMLVGALRRVDVQSVLSREAAHPVVLDQQAPYAVALFALDPVRNRPINAPMGTIFSVIPGTSKPAPGAAFLRSGRQILAAGFVLYGPALVMGVSLGAGTQLFVYDRSTRAFRRSHAQVSIPAGSAEFALNSSNVRHWEPPMRAFYDDLVAGTQGPAGEDYTMRWVGALTAETYRILQRGGIFLYPSDRRDGLVRGRLRLVYQAQPIAFLVEQAGGAAFDMDGPILDKTPGQLHERSPFFFGSRDTVHRVAAYISTPDFTGEHSPLFRRRSLFRG